MAPVQDGAELIVGTGRDARFRPIVLVGLGGVYAEIFGDVAVALAPVDPTTRSGSSSRCVAPLC
jgi:acetate---CoA ligase (ADP-forming)